MNPQGAYDIVMRMGGNTEAAYCSYKTIVEKCQLENVVCNEATCG
jgi:hypothetical protein